jgi:hypothetical protein
VFVVPKFREICFHAGMSFPAVYGFVFLVTQHSVLICGALIAVLILLEWRSNRWARYRRATFGVGVFLLNSAVLLLISFMMVYAVIAAVEISRHVK